MYGKQKTIGIISFSKKKLVILIYLLRDVWGSLQNILFSTTYVEALITQREIILVLDSIYVIHC